MPIGYVTKTLKRFFIYRVLHIDDTPHRIALGLAVGIFITWTPTMGLQMALTIMVAALFRANKLVGVPFVWISNPVTAIPLYGANYWLGTKVLPGDYSVREFAGAIGKALTSGGGWFDRIGAWWSATYQFFWPLWVGSILMGLILAVPTYFATKYAVQKYRSLGDRLHRFRARKTAAKAGDSKASAD